MFRVISSHNQSDICKRTYIYFYDYVGEHHTSVFLHVRCSDIGYNLFLLSFVSLSITRNLDVSACTNGRAVQDVGLRLLAWWDCGFESCRRHGCLSLDSVVCCQVEASATTCSLVQGSPTDSRAPFCVI
jgi:hypothetical protein